MHCPGLRIGARASKLATLLLGRNEDVLTMLLVVLTEVWSNDRYVAPVHRVKAQRSLERYSAPFFYNPSYETNYAPVSGTISDETPAKYRPINWGDFRLGRFRGDFADVGKEVQISDFIIQQ
jgi:isopenicillin N synthase-like dioxygenase